MRSSTAELVGPADRATDAEVRWSALPLTFSADQDGRTRRYLDNDASGKLLQFFQAKGLAALKQEDAQERWYEDWIAFQGRHQIYARLLSPRRYSALGGEMDLLRLARFLELFAYFSPAHGYSLQVTGLGLFAILMGHNEELKTEAVKALEAGGLLAFAASEQRHGSDLLANEFTVREREGGRLVAHGSKYYIGNSNSASLIAILARRQGRDGNDGDASRRRSPPVLFALRPPHAAGFRNLRKIRTLGVRGAYVGEFSVNNHEFGPEDLIAEGRAAWDAVLGTVTLGKFFLGFGSVGICERALTETIAHVKGRVLYGKPVIAIPHIRSKMAQAFARLSAMKLFAFRALDYLYSASPTDRRYLLFNAVQKAKVSTEGVGVVRLLAECMGAKGFEAETYFEMALRDIQLIPALEGSAHINLALAAQVVSRYFAASDLKLARPASALLEEIALKENPYLMEARSNDLGSVTFAEFAEAYGPLSSIENVRLLMHQAKAFAQFAREHHPETLFSRDSEAGLGSGQCLATIAYAQLVAENAVKLAVPKPLVSAMFHGIVIDLGAAATALASASAELDSAARSLLHRMIVIPRTCAGDWDWVSEQVSGL
jgi:acyl-CoA dehydrogenase